MTLPFNHICVSIDPTKPTRKLIHIIPSTIATFLPATLFDRSYHNEKKEDIAFPDWMEPSWHNRVIECFHCQRACPETRDFLKEIAQKEEFTEEETALLLQGVTCDQLPRATAEKLERLSLIDYLENLPRNLEVFFKKRTK